MRQPPAPSQAPSVPQPEAPLSVHWLSGSWPTGTSVQVPPLPVSAQDRQVPVQLELQQTPCWQRPDAHSAAVVQGAASGFFEHWPALQTLGDAQSLSVAQVVRHVPLVPQLKGAQAMAVAVWQTPAPLQVRGGVYVDPVQLPPAQVVPAP